MDVVDVLTCLGDEHFLGSLAARNAMKPSDIGAWWCRLFYFLAEACTNAGCEDKRVAIVRAALEAPIFTLVQHCPRDCDWRVLRDATTDHPQRVEPGRRCLPPLILGEKWRNAYLVAEDDRMLRFTWRWEHEVTLTAQSVEERSFLSQHLRITNGEHPFAVVNLTRRDLLDSIKRIHLDAQDSQVGSVEQVLCDLQIIREGWDQWVGDPMTKDATRLLYLPFCEDHVHRQVRFDILVFSLDRY